MTTLTLTRIKDHFVITGPDMVRVESSAQFGRRERQGCVGAGVRESKKAQEVGARR